MEVFESRSLIGSLSSPSETRKPLFLFGTDISHLIIIVLIFYDTVYITIQGWASLV